MFNIGLKVKCMSQKCRLQQYVVRISSKQIIQVWFNKNEQWTYFGGQRWVLHSTICASGWWAILQNFESTSVPVTLLRQIAWDILKPKTNTNKSYD